MQFLLNLNLPSTKKNQHKHSTKKHKITENHSLSGMRTSFGRGIVGLLSFWSMMITVNVADPASLGLPLSVAVITNLWVGKKKKFSIKPLHDSVYYIFTVDNSKNNIQGSS